MVVGEFFTYLGYIIIAWYCVDYVVGKIRGHATIDDFRHGWVAITGGSDGIGKGFALELVKREFKVVIIGRNIEKLETVCSEISQTTGNSDVKCIQADFAYSHRDPETFYTGLYEQLRPYNVSVLINNVGIAQIRPLSELSYVDLEQSIGVNVFSQTHLTHKLFPDFVRRYEQTRQRSLIINLSSFVGRVPFAGGSIYCATKRYNDYFSRATGLDRPDAVLTLSLTPAAVSTQLAHRDFGVKHGSPSAVQVDTWVRSALNSVGTEQAFGHWKHRLQGCLIELLPEFLRGSVISTARGRFRN